MTTLSENDNEALHRQYMKTEEIYRALQVPLTLLQERYGCLSPTDIWYQSEAVIDRLRQSRPYHAAEVPRIHSRLLKEAGELITITVLVVVCIRCANIASTDANPNGTNEGDDLLSAIFKMIKDDSYTDFVLQILETEAKDIFGNETVFTDSDPMKQDADDRLLPSERDNAATLMGIIKERTKGLKAVGGIDWQLWTRLWEEHILKDSRLVAKLGLPTPDRTRPMGEINAKMVCNVLGILREELHIQVAIQDLSDAMGYNYYTYIREHSCDAKGNPTTSCVLDRDECGRIKGFITQLQKPDNQSDKK